MCIRDSYIIVDIKPGYKLVVRCSFLFDPPRTRHGENPWKFVLANIPFAGLSGLGKGPIPMESHSKVSPTRSCVPVWPCLQCGQTFNLDGWRLSQEGWKDSPSKPQTYHTTSVFTKVDAKHPRTPGTMPTEAQPLTEKNLESRRSNAHGAHMAGSERQTVTATYLTGLFSCWAILFVSWCASVPAWADVFLTKTT